MVLVGVGAGESNMSEQSRQPIRSVIDHLVAGKFTELEMLTKGQRLSAPEIARAISVYGRRLVVPPDDAFKLMDVVEVRNFKPPQWSVNMPLWTEEEGRSDLSIGVTLISDGEGFKIELDDIHVL